MAQKLEAGDDTDAYCGKCKLVLAHVIIAMRGKRPARVECKTCSAVHAFKAEPPRTGARRATTRDKTAEALAQYESLMEGRDLSRAVKYKASQEFGLEDVLDHKTFGLGLVTRVLSDQKIEVTFQGGNKILVHAR
jgi:hypothetical protein